MTKQRNPFAGTWTYRSFRSNPEPVDDDIDKLRALLFGEGEMNVEDAPEGVFIGHLNFGPDFLMELRGSVSSPRADDTFQCRFQGVGITGTKAEGWVYDYLGYLIPMWPNGVDQRPAFVGSVIRTVEHSGGAAKAGYVACFIAVRRG